MTKRQYIEQFRKKLLKQHNQLPLTYQTHTVSSSQFGDYLDRPAEDVAKYVAKYNLDKIECGICHRKINNIDEHFYVLSFDIEDGSDDGNWIACLECLNYE